jgi:hypothetical protein
MGAAVNHVQTNVIPHVQEHFNNNVAPVIKVTIDNTVFHIQTNIAPAVHGAAIRLGEHMNNDIALTVKGGFDVALAPLRAKYGNTFETLQQITLQTAEEAQAWVAANPRKTAIIITSTSVLLAAGLVASPVLSALGFGAEGAAAGRSDSSFYQWKKH